ncbi:hypothetical protein TYRP_004149 [Tyrophagus putrescentiae]|nr:hypothetical protein TYRP_004149 [Tyrophagus putrescentiae]
MADNTSSDGYAKSWSHSKMTTFKIEHIWKIDQFSNMIFKSDINKFSPFFFVDGHDIKFKLRVKLNNDNDKEKKSLGFHLYCYPGETVEGDVPVTFELAFLKNDGNVKSNEREHTFSKVDRNGFGYSSFEKYSIIKDPKNNYLHEGHQLVARCKATVSYNEIQIQSFPVKDGINSESKFKSNQKSLLDSGELSDFTIVVGTTEIPVHKCVLSAHSPFFKAMFSHDCTKEAQEKKVIIPDVSIDAMKDFLQFIYTGYQVGDLKYLCADYLSSVLTIDNVANVYLVADLHNASGLKDNCLAFMASNFSQVLLSQGWLQMCKTGGEKMTEVCSAIGDILTSQKTSSKVDSEDSDSDEVPE